MMLEKLAKGLLEPLVKGLFYAIGWVFLNIFSLGNIQIQPLGHKAMPNKKDQYRVTIKGHKYLAKDVFILIGLLISIVACVAVYFLLK